MRTLIRAGVVTGIAAASIVFAAAPAHASTPAVVGCSFAGVYDSFDGSGAGLRGYAKRDDDLTVHSGNGDAYLVHVEEGFMKGADGWIEAACVRFIA